MATGEEEFRRKLLGTFAAEAEERLEAITSGILELEKAADAARRAAVVESVFREAHSLKGAARAVGSADVEAVCQSLEGIFAALKREGIAAPAGSYDLLHSAVDALRRRLSPAAETTAGPEGTDLGTLLQRLESLSAALYSRAPEESPLYPAGEQAAPFPSPAPDTVRLPAARLESLLLKAEELLGSKLAAAQRAADLAEIRAALAGWKKEWTGLKARLPASDGAAAESVERADRACAALDAAMASIARAADQDHRQLGRQVDALLAEMKWLLMLPFSSVLRVFPRLVRDLSRERGKEAELAIEGGEIEIDRRILQEIKDPLIHLVRNSIDHGIEKPQERRRKKKPPAGMIRIAIAQKNGDKAEIVVADDGAGIDLGKVKAAALRLGAVSAEEADRLSDREILPLIFHSGLSTSPVITDLSGRGIGLAIVREKVEKVGGAVFVETTPGGGTTFRLVLPLALATFHGVLVRTGDHLFIVPLSAVERTVRIAPQSIRTAENRETIRLNGSVLPLVRLRDVLLLPRGRAAADSGAPVPALVLGAAERRIAFAVDEVVSEQEVLVKSLGRQLARVRNVAGAAVLGSGRVVPVINVADLMQSAARTSAAAPPAPPPVGRGDVEAKSVLVVEDSITARVLIKNILESAGYRVATAVDGIDAYTQLRAGRFDVVVSDVDMPRMNGFDLTAKIRADRSLSELPVVLVTALESREDRERGIEVGASAYLVKSSFDHSNLLETIARLV
ncbi:MAG TPA: response regulator [candidate division Zixibacteria bacterium]|nr:response regulator [candidate division Zixibacteria bacterium]